MSKDKLHFRFNVGNGKSVCVEGGSGYGSPVLHDSVTISLRGITEKGKLGGREAVSFYVAPLRNAGNRHGLPGCGA